MDQVHFRCCHLGLARAYKAEFAHAQAIGREHRRPKDAAGKRSGGVQVAGAGNRIKSGAGFIVCEVGEALLVLGRLSQDAAKTIAGKSGGHSVQACQSAPVYPCRTLRFSLAQRGKALAEPHCIEHRDGKNAMAALRAARSAGQPVAGTGGCIRQGRVDNLHQFLVANWERSHHA